MAGTTNAASLTTPETLLGRFGLMGFRPGQQQVVDAVLSGADVLCVMPTGGGKSLCYQLPSLAREGTTIVVSPLIALMKDQVDALQRLGIRASLINSSLTGSEQAAVMQEMASGSLDLVYVAPERLRNGRFLEAISQVKVSLLAVDEAHCVSEWGHDFRPDYARLGKFRQRYLGNVQTIALTATATPTVQRDIEQMLGLRSPRIFVTGFARTNLRFSVSHAKSDRAKDEELEAYLLQQPGSGIIYAATRKRCEELAGWLPEKTRRPMGVYHAGLDPIQRQRVQDQFMSGQLSAIVATNAFGMGIDKADIRYVIHYNMPGSLEAYYQEAGRAGRDSLPSECRLLFSYSDRYIQEFFIENRYPSRETVRKVYEFLLSRPEDPIELTLDQVREAIQVKDGSEAVGTAETLLAKAGVLRRLDSNSNHAVVRIDSDAPTLLDFIPPEARIKRRVLQAVETLVGRQRGEDVFIQLPRLAELAGMDREQLSRTLRELNKLKSFDYVPPFRGRAIHFIERDTPFESLEIDFDELDRRKAAEYEKLESVIRFARTNHCRQRVILEYFGERNGAKCGQCDRCAPPGPTNATTGHLDVTPSESRTATLSEVDQRDLLRGIQVILSGVTRMHGRFGKQLVAQMLCGSTNKKLQQWKLHQLSTYGLLSTLKQSDVSEVMDCLIESALLEQREVDQHRPTLDITEFGREVMHCKRPLPDSLKINTPLARRLARALREIESSEVNPANAQPPSTSNSPSNSSEFAGSQPSAGEATPQSTALEDQLKRWRRKTSAAMGIPVYRVLTNATIERIAATLPQNLEQLSAISGVGPATIQQYGTDLLSFTTGVSLETSEAGQDAQDPGRQDPGRQDLGRQDLGQGIVETDWQGTDAYWTWRLFHDGYSAEQIGRIRGRDRDSLMGDLQQASESGQRVDPMWIRSDASQQKSSP